MLAEKEKILPPTILLAQKFGIWMKKIINKIFARVANILLRHFRQKNFFSDQNCWLCEHHHISAINVFFSKF